MSEIKDKCGKCEAKVFPGYDFCLSCGTKFSEIPPSTKKRSSTSETEKLPMTKEEKKMARTFSFSNESWSHLGGIGGIICLIGYLYNNFPLIISGLVVLVGLLIFLSISEFRY